MEKYEKIKVVGKGSFGAAWLVRNRKDGRKLIAKEIKLIGMKPQEKQEARNEVKLLAQLHHPNIVQYHDSFEANQALFIVMEYADAGDLAGKIKQQRGRLMREQEVMRYFCQLCLAIKHLHDRHILHRDLKCQNVFLTSDGVVKLGDFGIATVLRHTMALAHTICGTPYYFSPELCQNKPYNNKSDVWALGCILYELATLQHAFEGQNMKALMQKIVRGVYPPISGEYSKELRDLVASMLARDAAKRPVVPKLVANDHVQKHLALLGQDLGKGIKERKSLVSDEQKEEQRADARRRAAELQARRPPPGPPGVGAQLQARNEAARREAAEIIRKRESDLQQRLALMQQEQGARMRQAEQKEKERELRAQQNRAELERREKEREADRLKREEERREKDRELREKQQRDREEKQRRQQEELKKWRERKRMEDLEQEKLREREAERNRLREEQWERQQAQMAEERERQLERQRAAEIERQHQREEQRRQVAAAHNAAAAAYWEARKAANDNRRRFQDDLRGPPPDPHGDPANGDPAAYDPPPPQPRDDDSAEARRQAHLEMRREAERNRRRFKGYQEGRGPSSGLSDADAAPAAQPDAPPRRHSPGRRPDDADVIEQHRQAHLEMRREAQRNRRRLEADVRGVLPPGGVADEPQPVAAAAAAAPPPDGRRPAARDPASADIDAAERRRIFLENREQQLRNRRRIEADVRGQGSPDEPSPASPPDGSPAMARCAGAEDDAPGSDDEQDVGEWINGVAAAEPAEGPGDAWVDDYQDMVQQIAQLSGDHFPAGDGAGEDGDAEFGDQPLPENVDAVRMFSKFKMDGKTLELPNVKASDPLMYRVESLRVYLSDCLGEEPFIRAYRLMDSIAGDSPDDVVQQAEALVGEANKPLLQLISQLIFCEDQVNAELNRPLSA